MSARKFAIEVEIPRDKGTDPVPVMTFVFYVTREERLGLHSAATGPMNDLPDAVQRHVARGVAELLEGAAAVIRERADLADAVDEIPEPDGR
jgi:hypothetical protein